MYYLQSRYYDPEICRFINCDDVNYIGATESVVSYNPFAYCGNEPISKIDPFGCIPYNISVAFNALGISAVAYAKFLCVRLYCWGFTHRKKNQTYDFSQKWKKLITKQITGSKAIKKFVSEKITFMKQKNIMKQKFHKTINFYNYMSKSVSDLDLTLSVGGGGQFDIIIQKLKVKNGKNYYRVIVKLSDECFDFHYWKMKIGDKEFGNVDPHTASQLVTLINNVGYFTQYFGAFVKYNWKFNIQYFTVS